MLKNVVSLFLITVLFQSVVLFAQDKLDGNCEEAVSIFTVGNALVESYLDRSAATQNVLIEATERYNRTIRLCPQLMEAYYNKGLSIMYNGSEGERRYYDVKNQFEKVLQIAPDFIDAKYALAYASYYINSGSKAQGSNNWNSSISPSISMLKEITSKHPGTTAADNAKKMLVYIDWARDYGFQYQLYGRAKRSKPNKPEPELLRISEDAIRKQSIKTAITETRKGIISDESHKFTFVPGTASNPYFYDGKVYNTAGVPLHIFSVKIDSYDGQYDDTFKSLYITLDYDGWTVKKGVIPLPDAGAMAMASMRGNLNKTPKPLVNYSGIRIGLLIEDVDVDPRGPNRYKSVTARIIIDITE